MSIQRPFNFKKWIDENRHLLKPPVGNQSVYKTADNIIVMVVGGPNNRKDYHYNETEELFYQLEGEITIKIQVDGKREDVKMTAGDMYLLPAKVPHSPGRTAGSVGLVIERVREGKGFTDGLLWFCDSCNHKLHEAYFELKNIETDFLNHFNEFYDSEHLRTCKNCGEVLQKP